MGARGRLRELLLQPADDDAPVKPTPTDLAGKSRAERRAARIQYQKHAGVFRTWVYAVILVALVGGFALFLWVVS